MTKPHHSGDTGFHRFFLLDHKHLQICAISIMHEDRAARLNHACGAPNGIWAWVRKDQLPSDYSLRDGLASESEAVLTSALEPGPDGNPEPHHRHPDGTPNASH